jgi:hypothetical protein
MKISYINKFLDNPCSFPEDAEGQVQRLGNGTFNICCNGEYINVPKLNEVMPIHSDKPTLEALVYYFDLAKTINMLSTANLMFPLLYKKALRDSRTLLYYEFYNIDTYLDLAVVQVNGVRCCIPVPLLDRETALRFLKSGPQMVKKLRHNRTRKPDESLKLAVDGFFNKYFDDFSREFVSLRSADVELRERLSK